MHAGLSFFLPFFFFDFFFFFSFSGFFISARINKGIAMGHLGSVSALYSLCGQKCLIQKNYNTAGKSHTYQMALHQGLKGQAIVCHFSDSQTSRVQTLLQPD